MDSPWHKSKKIGHEQILLNNKKTTNKNTNRFFPSVLPEVHDIAENIKRLVGHSSY